MKKQTAVFLSFSALLTIGAMAPNTLWQADKDSHRSPASIEQKDRIGDVSPQSIIKTIFSNKIETKKTQMELDLDAIAEDTRKNEAAAPLKDLEIVDIKSHGPVTSVEAPTPLKDLEHIEVAIESREVKLVVVDAQVSCLKDTQPKDLEAEVKKLMEDKEKIMKELEELRAASKKEDKIEDKKEDIKQDKKKFAKADYNEDILGIMSQLSSLMISQQQQQMMMMNQMFSMFQSQQPKQQSWYSPMSDYMSPYAFNASQFEFPSNHSPYSIEGMGNKIGLGYPGPFSQGGFSEYFNRAPAQLATFDQMPVLERGQINLEGSFLPQAVRPHNGFDFRDGNDAMTMQRVQF